MEQTNIDLEDDIGWMVDGEEVAGLSSNNSFGVFEQRYPVRRDPGDEPTAIFLHERHALRYFVGWTRSMICQSLKFLGV